MIDRLVAAIIAHISEHLWKIIMIEVRVSRAKMVATERIEEFKKHVDAIEGSVHDSDELKNERLDNAARTLLYGVRKPLP